MKRLFKLTPEEAAAFLVRGLVSAGEVPLVTTYNIGEVNWVHCGDPCKLIEIQLEVEAVPEIDKKAQAS